MVRTSLNVHQMVPGQIYRIRPKYTHDTLTRDGMGIYHGYTLNFNCTTNVSRYSPNMKYFVVLKQGRIIDPATVKVGDTITLHSKQNPRMIVENVLVRKISYIYEFSKYYPPLPQCEDDTGLIEIYASYANIYEPLQTLMELSTLNQLDTIELEVVPDGHRPRVLIDDVIGYMKQFFTKTKEM